MQAADLVDAVLVGLDQGEMVTIPGRYEGDAWTRWEQERRDLAPKFRNPNPATRYATA